MEATNNMMTKKKSRGATAVEYAVMLSLIAVISLPALGLLGTAAGKKAVEESGDGGKVVDEFNEVMEDFAPAEPVKVAPPAYQPGDYRGGYVSPADQRP